jgi:nucleotide-binding universal stress UspA family protein
LLDGAPAAALAQATDDKAVDLIVVGHRGLGALKRIVLGSVLARLAHTCSRALLIAPVASEASGT